MKKPNKKAIQRFGTFKAQQYLTKKQNKRSGSRKGHSGSSIQDHVSSGYWRK